MGQKWDARVPGPPFWQAILRVCKPGATLLSFGGTRTSHRLACAIEDAGWEIRDGVCWLYGTGFPKSYDLSKAIDKAAGASRVVLSSGQPIKRMIPGADQDKTGSWIKDNGREFTPTVTAPTTAEARRWDGWGTALKPAWEPILLAQKPLEGTYAQNALRHGVAGLNIDGARIGTDDGTRVRPPAKPTAATYAQDAWTQDPANRRPFDPVGQGRWPANLLLSHHPDCRQRGAQKVKGITGGKKPNRSARRIYGKHQNPERFNYADAAGIETVQSWDCHPDCPVGMLDQQSAAGGMHSAEAARAPVPSHTQDFSVGGGPLRARPAAGRIGDTGGASRFFYCAKAPRKERWFYCRDCADAFPAAAREDHAHGHTTPAGKPCWKHLAQHPTVKPQAIMRYLCRLTATPSGGTVLDPFMGTGSTGVAAVQEGRPFIGIELDPESFWTAVRRIEHEL
jgi:hypothetical protein